MRLVRAFVNALVCLLVSTSALAQHAPAVGAGQVQGHLGSAGVLRVLGPGQRAVPRRPASRVRAHAAPSRRPVPAQGRGRAIAAAQAVLSPSGTLRISGVASHRWSVRGPSRWAFADDQIEQATVVAAVANPGGGVTHSIVVTLHLPDGQTTNPSGEAIQGVFKTYNFAHEIAAYRVSATLGLDIVPPTVPFTYNGQAGSLQLFVPRTVVANQAAAVHGAQPQTLDAPRTELMHVLDYMIQNVDRHGGNYLFTSAAPAELFAIDHGHATFGGAIVGYPHGSLSEPVRELLARADLTSVARALRTSGIAPPNTEIILTRFEQLRVAFRPGGAPAAQQALTPEALASIRQAANAVY